MTIWVWVWGMGKGPERSLGQRRACSRIAEAWRCHRHSVKSDDGPFGPPRPRIYFEAFCTPVPSAPLRACPAWRGCGTGRRQRTGVGASPVCGGGRAHGAPTRCRCPRGPATFGYFCRGLSVGADAAIMTRRSAWVARSVRGMQLLREHTVELSFDRRCSTRSRHRGRADVDHVVRLVSV